MSDLRPSRPVNPARIQAACAVSRYAACYTVAAMGYTVLKERHGAGYRVPQPAYDPAVDRVIYGAAFAVEDVDLGYEISFYRHMTVIDVWSGQRRLSLTTLGPPDPAQLGEDLPRALAAAGLLEGL